MCEIYNYWIQNSSGWTISYFRFYFLAYSDCEKVFDELHILTQNFGVVKFFLSKFQVISIPLCVEVN